MIFFSGESLNKSVAPVGVAVAVAVGITVAMVPTTVGISGFSTFCAFSVGIGGGADFFDELPILLQQFINCVIIYCI